MLTKKSKNFGAFDGKKSKVYWNTMLNMIDFLQPKGMYH